MFFWNAVTSQPSMVPSPRASSCHCRRTAGFSVSLRLRTTRWATRSLWMMSTWVAMKAGDARPPKITAETGSGLKSTTTLASALYCLGRIRLTTTVVATVTSRTSSATHQRARKIDRNWPNVIANLF